MAQTVPAASGVLPRGGGKGEVPEEGPFQQASFWPGIRSLGPMPIDGVWCAPPLPGGILEVPAGARPPVVPMPPL